MISENLLQKKLPGDQGQHLWILLTSTQRESGSDDQISLHPGRLCQEGQITNETGRGSCSCKDCRTGRSTICITDAGIFNGSSEDLERISCTSFRSNLDVGLTMRRTKLTNLSHF